MEYPNLPRSIGAVLSMGKATVRDLDEWLSVEDVYDLLEIATVDAQNSRTLSKLKERT